MKSKIKYYLLTLAPIPCRYKIENNIVYFHDNYGQLGWQESIYIPSQLMGFKGIKRVTKEEMFLELL